MNDKPLTRNELVETLIKFFAGKLKPELNNIRNEFRQDIEKTKSDLKQEFRNSQTKEMKMLKKEVNEIRTQLASQKSGEAFFRLKTQSDRNRTTN
jgi:vacuolar-type H+-ATPase subunit E/Vma4